MPRYSSKRGRGGSISASHAGSGAHGGSVGSASGGGAAVGANAAPSIQFGAVISERKATAAKSAGTIGKWGVTSFTSIRSSIVNGGSRVMDCGGASAVGSGRSTFAAEKSSGGFGAEPSGDQDPFSFQSNTPTATNGTAVPKVKKFFKSRNTPAVVAAAAAVAEQRRQLHAPQPAVAPLTTQKQADQPSLEATIACDNADMQGGDGDTKRFFSSPAQLVPNRDNSSLPDNRLPPLKLRISRDKDTGDLTAGVTSPSSMTSSPDKSVSPPLSPSPDSIAGTAPVVKKRRPPGRPPGHVNKASRRGAKCSPPPLLRAPHALPPPSADTSAPTRRSRRAAAAEARERVAQTVRECDGEGAVFNSAEARLVVTNNSGGCGDGEEVEMAETRQHGRSRRLSSQRALSQEDKSLNHKEDVIGSVSSTELPTIPETITSGKPINPQSGNSTSTAADTFLTSAPSARDTSTTADDTEEESHTVSIASCDRLESQLNNLFDGATGDDHIAADTESGDQQQQQQQRHTVDASVAEPPVETMESKVYTKGVKDLYRYERLRGSENSNKTPVTSSTTSSSVNSDSASTHISSASSHNSSTSAVIDSAHNATSHSSVHYSSIADKLHVLDGESACENDEEKKEDGFVPRLSRSFTEPVGLSLADSSAANSAVGVVSASTLAATSANQPGSVVSADSQISSGSSTTSTSLVETRKPGSIFKSRAGRSTRARYQHRWTDDSGPNQQQKQLGPGGQAGAQSGSTGGSVTGGVSTATLSSLDFCDEPDTDRVTAPGVGITSASTQMTSSVGCAGVTSGDPADPAMVTRLVRVNTWHGSGSSSDLDATGQMVTSVKCHRAAKEYYTLIKNVKKAYQVQELGEYQEYNDDIEYIMDALRSTNSVMTRCLSALRLAEKCTVAAFRMHVRAQGTAVRFFAALRDAAAEPSLALCTAAVMFTLSQDQLNMDLDKTSLELMLALIDSDSAVVSSETNAELEKHLTKVRSLCAQLQRQGHAKTIDLPSISSSYLAMETLLSLTSERAGAWFKEELRTLGGLDHLLRTVCQSRDWLNNQLTPVTSDPRGQLAAESLITTLRKVERCLRVIENVTSRNEENQGHLLCCESAITALCSLLVLFQCRLAMLKPQDFIEATSAAGILLSTTKTLLKVLVNISHEPRSARTPLATYGSSAAKSAAKSEAVNNKKLGSWQLGQRKGLLAATVSMVVRVVPHALPECQQFDAWLLNTYLLINLTETQECNQTALASMTYDDVIALSGQSAADSADSSDVTHCLVISKLVDLFYRLVALASEVENNADRLLESDLYTAQSETNSGSNPAGNSQDGGGGGTTHNNGSSTVASEAELVSQTASALVQKAGHHMEKTVIAAYIGVIIGHIAMSKKERETTVQQYLRGGQFAGVVEVLTKLLNFLDLTKTGRADSQEMKTIRRVLNYMRQVDASATNRHEPLSPSHITDSSHDVNSINMFD